MTSEGFMLEEFSVMNEEVKGKKEKLLLRGVLYFANFTRYFHTIFFSKKNKLCYLADQKYVTVLRHVSRNFRRFW